MRVPSPTLPSARPFPRVYWTSELKPCHLAESLLQVGLPLHWLKMSCPAKRLSLSPREQATLKHPVLNLVPKAVRIESPFQALLR